jgi:nicotinate-nucleotide pyrophosphorylase (carboxylating)
MRDLEQEVRRTILLALKEDRAECDVTSQACISKESTVEAELLLKQNSLIAGLRFLPVICETIDPHLSWRAFAEDGREYGNGTVLASIRGNTQSILSGERTALNFLQHVSGVAQLTSQYVQAVAGWNCDILDTRKTLPGLRAIQKYAVVAGGGKNHRFDLEERFLIKNNHLKILLEETARPVREAILRARILQPDAKIEIEVESLAMLEEALSAQADLILLDNMPPELIREAVQLANGKVYLEASGGITLENVRAYAETGVNGVSIGALTHSVPAVDISLRI